MELKCKDCGDDADPSLTMRAADYGSDGPDLHFCGPCNDAGDLAFTVMEKLLATDISASAIAEHTGGLPN